MADAEPTIHYTTRAGKPVVEVGGTWTVFSLRGIRQKVEKALQAAGAGRKAKLLVVSRSRLPFDPFGYRVRW